MRVVDLELTAHFNPETGDVSFSDMPVLAMPVIMAHGSFSLLKDIQLSAPLAQAQFRVRKYCPDCKGRPTIVSWDPISIKAFAREILATIEHMPGAFTSKQDLPIIVTGELIYTSDPESPPHKKHGRIVFVADTIIFLADAYGAEWTNHDHGMPAII